MFVNIKFVNLPGPQSSGKFGSIVTQEGVKVMVPIHLLPAFRQGLACEIGTKDTTWGGNPVIVATSGPGGMPQGQAYGQGYQASNQAPANQRPNTGFQPKVIAGGGGVPPLGNPNVGHEEEKSRNIFVCGVVQQAMSSGKFAASEIAVLTAEANRSFDLIGKRPTPQHTLDQMTTDPAGEPQGYADDPGPELQ